MKMMVPDINEIWEEILSEKMIKKNRQYGNSVYDEDTIFSNVGDPEELIKIRLDDKMRRLKTLDPESNKYDSELMEIVAYLMHLLNWRRNNGKYEEEDELKDLGQFKVKEDEKIKTIGNYKFQEDEEAVATEEQKEEWRQRCGVKLATGYRQPRDTERSSESLDEILKRKLRRAGVW